MRALSVINIMCSLLLVVLYSIDVYLGIKVSPMAPLIGWLLVLANNIKDFHYETRR